MEEFDNIKNKINIKDIKCSFYIEKIFSFLYKNQKLKMVVYNKGFQKM